MKQPPCEWLKVLFFLYFKLYNIGVSLFLRGNAMPKRGGCRGGVKPTLPESLKRQSLSCRVAPETKKWLVKQRDDTIYSI